MFLYNIRNQIHYPWIGIYYGLGTACLSNKVIVQPLKEYFIIENLWIALEKGSSVDRITKRLEQREAEKAKLAKAQEKMAKIEESIAALKK